MRAAACLLPICLWLTACSTTPAEAPGQPALGTEAPAALAMAPASLAPPTSRLGDMVTVSAGTQPAQARAAALPAAVAAPTPAATQAALRTLPPEQQAFAQELATSRELPLAGIVAALQQASRNDTVLRLMVPPPAVPDATPRKRHWPGYRSRFVEPVRIRHGLRFWSENVDALARAEQATGVPAAVIVAVIGVETVYGRNMGNFPVLDALYTLAFHWPANASRDRSPYFRSELGEYLAMTLGQGRQPGRLRGSYAGAIGIPQFMPGSIRHYAVSARPGQAPDLVNSPDDAIASVANYLREHGWEPGVPVFIDATLPPKPDTWVAGGLEPTRQWRELQQAGAQPRRTAMAGLVSAPLSASAEADNPKVGVINLDHATGHVDYRIATANFFAITHYNRSYFYAAAVADLAAALEAQRRSGGR